MGIERYVEKMCLANPHLKENNLISKWKLAQPNREKSPELERLLRERFQEGHHHNLPQACRQPEHVHLFVVYHSCSSTRNSDGLSLSAASAFGAERFAKNEDS